VDGVAGIADMSGTIVARRYMVSQRLSTVAAIVHEKIPGMYYSFEKVFL
jgi:hypothetical protein